MTKKKSNKDPNIGNKTFSLNTEELKSSFIKSNITFLIYYYIITFVYFYFSNTGRCKFIEYLNTNHV